jgi:hypothetical protein
MNTVIIMRGTLTMTIAASLAALAFAGAKPAVATPAGAALAYGETNAGVVEHVARRDRYVRRWNRGYSWGYPGYAYRPYYRPYYRPTPITTTAIRIGGAGQA